MTRKNLILIVLRAFSKILNRMLCSIRSGVWAAFLRNDFSNIIYTGNVLCYDNSRIGFARLISFPFLSILNYFMS